MHRTARSRSYAHEILHYVPVRDSFRQPIRLFYKCPPRHLLYASAIRFEATGTGTKTQVLIYSRAVILSLDASFPDRSRWNDLMLCVTMQNA